MSAPKLPPDVLESLIPHLPDALWRTAPDGTTLFVSDMMTELTGYSVHEILNGGADFWRRCLHPDDLPDARAAYDISAMPQGRFDMECRLRRKDGRWIWIHARAVGAVGEDGAVYIDGITTDITARKQAEESLRNSEEKYRRRVENSYDLILEADAQGACLYASPSFRHILGYDPAALIGVPMVDLIHPDDLAAGQAALSEILREGVVKAVIYRLRHCDGRWRWLESACRMFKAEGDASRIIAVARDITERREAEELARQQQATLAHLSRVSTMGQLASGLAHELNQPLGAIFNYARASQDLLEQKGALGDSPEDGAAAKADKALGHALQEIVNATQRAAEIIRRLRAFLHKHEPRSISASLPELLEESLHLLTTECAQRRVTVRREIQGALRQVLADPVQIEQVVINLLQNAMDAMDDLPPAQREIIVRAAALDSSTALVEVVDRGSGVLAEHIGQIFDAFFTTKEQGLGIGLSISRSIIESHGGHLEAQCNSVLIDKALENGPGAGLRDGRGMTFRFTIPFA